MKAIFDEVIAPKVPGSLLKQTAADKSLSLRRAN